MGRKSDLEKVKENAQTNTKGSAGSGGGSNGRVKIAFTDLASMGLLGKSKL